MCAAIGTTILALSGVNATAAVVCTGNERRAMAP
jgi:hypothetical protein